ncbi:MAG: deoxyribodipyrimidine photo-lyase [Pseudomonadota bacterium]
MSKAAPTVVWFHNALRLADHPALSSAVENAGPVVPIFVLDDEGDWAIGSASRWWLHHSLKSLSADLKERGVDLILRRGKPIDVLCELANETGAAAVHFTRNYEPGGGTRERELKEALDEKSIACKRYRGRLLMDPEDIRTQAGDVYKVYTPFWRSLASQVEIGKAIPAPKKLKPYDGKLTSDKLNDWSLCPTDPNWAESWSDLWTPGEAGAHDRLDDFLENALEGYDKERNRPDHKGTSRLSPHLHFGEISPQALWRATTVRNGDVAKLDADRETFLKEVVWREFSAHLLFHFEHLPDSAFKEKFNDFPWQSDDAALKAWQRGKTGYPIVDAGMRELYATGWMHNRVRMITASFLIKHLLIPWQEGEKWFWDTLVDADLASNSASWQWVAGSGADASPYFRIFNPITQGQKFDPNGDYVRKWVPEIVGLPTKVLHAPFEADAETLKKAGVVLGETYPDAIVNHSKARQRALDGYEKIKD